ncbi:hypothetical protein BDF14DRAFT_1781071 [Spinellus fusiger]|nr:hypothetical protein BDF14DRAFT_1781071 [Spinellus fusiger]
MQKNMTPLQLQQLQQQRMAMYAMQSSGRLQPTSFQPTPHYPPLPAPGMTPGMTPNPPDSASWTDPSRAASTRVPSFRLTAQPSSNPAPRIGQTFSTPPGAARSVPAAVPHVETTQVNTPGQRQNLTMYQDRDKAYQETLNIQHKRHIHLAQEKKRDLELTGGERRARSQHGPLISFGPGYSGYGNGTTGLQTRIVYPQQRKRMRHAREFRFTLEEVIEQADKEDTLVPIRIDLEIDGYKLRDTFTWNLNETLVTYEQFANVLCEDLRLPVAAFAPQIARTLRDQIQDYYLHSASMVTKEETEEEKEEPMESDGVDIKEEEKKSVSRELRMLIRLDITVGNRALLDQFEWDISCQRNSPEAFAQVMSTELGLGGEFKTAIAHSIREQIYVYIKSLLLVGHEFNDSPVTDDDLKHSFLPALKSIIREGELVERFTPALLELTDAEVEKIEKDRMREARRKRRQTRGRRGILLPDREPLKTNRTVYAIPPDQEMTDDQFMTSIHTTARAPGYDMTMHSQRRSALRARMNIAAEAAGNQPPHPGQSMQSVIALHSINKAPTDTPRPHLNG